MNQVVVLFHSNNYAIWAKKVLEKSAIPCQLISVPRHLSSDCGYCLCLASDHSSHAEQLLLDQNIEFDRIAEYEE